MGNNTTKRDVQLAQFDTLMDIKNFCNKEGLKYWLHCGTLLGCIRHGGFVPWDEDIDIAMPLPDYKKFEKSFFNFKPDKYDIDSLNNNKYYHLRRHLQEDERRAFS